MDKASLVLSEGADFLLLGPEETMIESRVPVISVCAVRTGCGKSVITRKDCQTFEEEGNPGLCDSASHGLLRVSTRSAIFRDERGG